MKKLFILLFLFLSVNIGNAQGCLPEGITFTTQAQIDSFQINYPDCTEIEGSVEIRGYITNLDGLSVITSIGCDLLIGTEYNGGNYYLSSIEGLNNLEYIGCSLRISDNEILSDLSGLERLKHIGGVFSISYNPNLISFVGLDSLNSIGGNMYISDGKYTDFTGLGSLTYVGGNIYITYNDSLLNFSGLSSDLTGLNGFIFISANRSLVNLSGLDNLNSIGGNLTVSRNDNFTDFAGLNNLDSIGGDLRIRGNDSLNSIANLDNLTYVNGIYIGGSDWRSGNHALTSLIGLENTSAESLNNLHIENNSNLSMCEVQSICEYLLSPNGDIFIINNASGCDSQEEVEEACNIVTTDENSFPINLKMYPNPFTTSTSIEYELKHPERVVITFYNHLDELVDKILTDQAQGLNRVVWTPVNLPNGIYHFRVQAGEQVGSGKVVLLN